MVLPDRSAVLGESTVGGINLKLLILIPAYNEAENIERVVNNLIENYPQYDYVIINDGSTDATRQVCVRNLTICWIFL